MATGTKERANTDDVHAQLRADILGGVHAPGVRLKFTELGDRYHASISVLREALTRLEQQRLVTGEPRIGFRVATLSSEELRDLTQTRIAIESIAVAQAIEHGDVETESEMVAAHHRMARTPFLEQDGPPRVSDAWERAHSAFHRAVVAGCRSPWLIGITDTLRDCAELHRRWSGSYDPGRDLASEHQRILDAVLAKDPDEAARALRDHYQHTLTILEQRLGAQ